MLGTTAWSYCPRVGFGLHDGIAPRGALFQGKPPTPLCPLTDPGWKRSGSKSVMEAAATPPGSRAKLTNVASTPTIAARGAGRVRRLESRTATPLSGEHVGPDRKSPDLAIDLTPVLHGRSTYRGGPASCRSQGRRMVAEAPGHQPHNNVADRAWAPRAALNGPNPRSRGAAPVVAEAVLNPRSASDTCAPGTTSGSSSDPYGPAERLPACAACAFGEGFATSGAFKRSRYAALLLCLSRSTGSNAPSSAGAPVNWPLPHDASMHSIPPIPVATALDRFLFFSACSPNAISVVNSGPSSERSASMNGSRPRSRSRWRTPSA